MATAREAAGAAAKTSKKTPAKTAKATAARTSMPAKAPAITKPIKPALSKTGLNNHLAEASGVDPKSVKAVVATLESTIAVTLHKPGLGEFTLPGLLKATVKVPAKKKRFGKDPFTRQERWFPAKPATTKVKVQPMKKLKHAAGG